MKLVRARTKPPTPSRHFARDENGAALLEMTVVTPFLVIFGLGLFEFSNALYQYHLITGGIRDAARYAAGLPLPVGEINQNEVCDENDPGSTPLGCAKRLALTGEIADGGGRRVSWWEAEDITITYPSIENEEDGVRQYRGPDDITRVLVTTQFVYEGLGFLGALGLDPFTITTAHEERHYGIR